MKIEIVPFESQNPYLREVAEEAFGEYQVINGETGECIGWL